MDSAEKKQVIDKTIDYLTEFIGKSLRKKLDEKRLISKEKKRKKSVGISFDDIKEYEGPQTPEEVKKELDDLVKLALAKHGLIEESTQKRKPKTMSERMKESLQKLSTKKK